jgi:hypothetical protein
MAIGTNSGDSTSNARPESRISNSRCMLTFCVEVLAGFLMREVGQHVVEQVDDGLSQVLGRCDRADRAQKFLQQAASSYRPRS